MEHGTRNGYSNYKCRCEPCKAAYSVYKKEFWKNNPKRVIQKRQNHLKTRYNLTLERFDEMMREQGFGCGICGRPENVKALHVDHCHETGVVRGLLCAPCNGALGRFGDNLEGVMRVVDYLQRGNQTNDQAPSRILEHQAKT